MREVVFERCWNDIILPADLAGKLVELLAQGTQVEHAHARREVEGEKYGVTSQVPFRGGPPSFKISGMPPDLCATQSEAQTRAEAEVEKRVSEKLAQQAEKRAEEGRELLESDKGGEQGLDEALEARSAALIGAAGARAPGDTFSDE